MPDYVPDTQVRVLTGVPLDSTYSDTIKFNTVGDQTAFFFGKTKYTYTNFTYQRVNSSVANPRRPQTIRVPQLADDLYDCNYLMFRNKSFEGKWFYAFIKQVNYISPEVTELVYELDHYQTWCTEFEVLPCFVEREHYVNVSGQPEPLFANTQPEPVNLGVYSNRQYATKYYALSRIIVASTTDETGEEVAGEIISGRYSGTMLKEFDNTAANVNSYIKKFAEKGRLDAIVAIQQSPFSKSEFNGSDVVSEEWRPADIKLTTNYQFGYYTPKNKKLISYPYLYYTLSNADGNSTILYPQLFHVTSGAITEYQPVFTIQKVYGIPPTAVCTPNNYGLDNIVNLNYTHSAEFNEVPPSSWSGNAYTNWLAQNQMSMALRAVSSTIGAVGSAVVGNVGGVVSNAIGLGSIVAENNKASMMAPKLNGTPISANFNAALRRFGFEARIVSITPEYAQRIDTFFDMFGYAQNIVKVPEMEGRESWNFVKTKDCIIKGSLPVDSMDRIKQMFNDGIRFWHGDFVGNYSLSNEPVPLKEG